MTTDHARRPEREETFTFDRGALVRQVVPRRGEPYEHRCTLETFTEVAHAVAEAGDDGATIDTIVAASDLPFSQVAVALAFMRERGCIEPVHGRRHVASSAIVVEDALTEWHALREKGPQG